MEVQPVTGCLLPDDIIYEILLFADQLDRGFEHINDEPSVDPKVPVRVRKPVARAISEVSSSWRALVDEWPRCWAMTLVLHQEGPPIHQVIEALGASRGCDLDVWIYWHENWSKHIIPVLLPHAKQIRLLSHEHSARYIQSVSGAASGIHQLGTALNPSRLSHINISKMRESSQAFLELHTNGFNGVVPNVRIHETNILALQKMNIRAINLEIHVFYCYNPATFVSWVESIQSTEKLRLSINCCGWGGTPSPDKFQHRTSPRLRALRVGESADSVKFYLFALDTGAVSKLFIDLSPRGRHFHHLDLSPWTGVRHHLRSLVEVALCLDLPYPPWIEGVLTVLPWSQITKFTVDSTTRAKFKPSDYPNKFPRSNAERLTSFNCKFLELPQILFLLKMLNFPVLTDLFIEIAPSQDFPNVQPAEEVDWPQLSRIAISVKGRTINLEELTSLTGLFKTSALRQLDLSRICLDFGHEPQRSDAWSSIHMCLSNLEALSIAAPANHTQLIYCFEHCENLRVLNLRFFTSTPIDAILPLADVDSRCLPNLETLQLQMPVKESRELTDIVLHLRLLTSHRKALGKPIKELGILFPPDQEGMDIFLGLSLDVNHFVVGDVCKDTFPNRTSIDAAGIWNSW